MRIIPSDHISPKHLVPLLPQGLQQRIRDSHYLSKPKSACLTDEVDLGVIAELVKKGDTMMDIGANFGLFTRFLSEQVGEEGKVYSFEPTAAMSRILNHNVDSLNLENVETSSCALSDKVGTAQISMPLHNNHSPNYYEASLCEINDAEIGEVDTVETTPNLGGSIDWDEAQARYRELSMRALAERLGMDDLEENIEVEKIYTPKTWETELDIFKGATFNLSHCLSQLAFMRPRNRFEEFRNCYLVGGGTHPGSGLPTIFESARISSNLISDSFGLSYTKTPVSV